MSHNMVIIQKLPNLKKLYNYNMLNEIEIKRQTINEIVKKIVVRIKNKQQDIKNAYSQEDVWIEQGIETELIHLKIELEKYRKSLKI